MIDESKPAAPAAPVAPPAPAAPAAPGAPAAPAAPSEPAAPAPPVEPGLMDFDPTKGAAPPPGGDAIYRPEGLGDDLAGKTDKETIDKLLARATGLRTALAEKGLARPDKADDYKLEGLPEDVAKLFDEKSAADAPVMKAIRDAMFKADVPVKKYNQIVGSVLSELSAAGLLAPAQTPAAQVQLSGAAEFKKLSEAFGGEDKAKQIQADEKAYIGSLVQSGILSADDGAVLAVDFMGTADGLRLFQKLRAHWTGHELPAQGDGGTAAPEYSAIQARYGDPQYLTDPAFRAETDRLERDYAAAHRNVAAA